MTDTFSNSTYTDHQVFEKLFREYHARLCAYSTLMTKNEDVSSEIVQDLFLKFWENRERVDVKLVKSYLFKAVHNNTLQYLMKSKKFESIEVGKEYGFADTSDYELTEKLELTINELPPKCKEIFVMSRIDKLKHNKIADKLGISSKTVEVQVRKASIILKEKLKEFKYLIIFIY